MRGLAKQAENLQIELGWCTYGESDMTLRDEQNHRHPHLSSQRNVVIPSTNEVKENREGKIITVKLGPDVKRELREIIPPCLNDDCKEKGGRHCIRNFANSSEELEGDQVE